MTEATAMIIGRMIPVLAVSVILSLIMRSVLKKVMGRSLSLVLAVSVATIADYYISDIGEGYPDWVNLLAAIAIGSVTYIGIVGWEARRGLFDRAGKAK